MRPVITLLTDFGTRDSFVGVMKGVILTICPDAQLVDITHAIPPQDVTTAALTVPTYVPYFPAGTVHVVVVDPGVGSARHPSALATEHAAFVGPDNGVFSAVWPDVARRREQGYPALVQLDDPHYMLASISETFHGRDIFAPAAAYLASGIALAQLGTPLDTIVTLPEQTPTQDSATSLVGQVVLIDHFGNCMTNISHAQLDELSQHADRAAFTVRVGAHMLPLHRTYADVAPGAPLALIGANGMLEISVRDGNAHEALDIERGATVRIAWDASRA
jgi:hypothetical protein